MIYSEPQKKLLEYIAETNEKCNPSTMIRKIMGITDLSVVEFNEVEKEVNFYTSKTGDNMIAQRFIQCLVLLDKLESKNMIFIERGDVDLSTQNYIGIAKSIKPISEIKKGKESKPEKITLPFCNKFYDPKFLRPIQLCGTHRTNAYELILKYTAAIVYPTPEFIEFVEKGFKTPEDFRFEKQLETEREQHRKEIKWTQRTLIAAILIPLITCIIDNSTDSNVTLLNKDMKIELTDTIHTQVLSNQSYEKDTSKVMLSDKQSN